jgi:hypothetical protein
MPFYCTAHILYNYMSTGHWPQFLQGNNWLYRKGNYGVQHTANANPDNHWDKRWYCWSTDPTCGLDIAPKRPHLDLKDPTILAKFGRDANVGGRQKLTGFGGF